MADSVVVRTSLEGLSEAISGLGQLREAVERLASTPGGTHLIEPGWD